MQIAIFVGHRPRPPSDSGAPLFPSFFFSFPIFFSRSGITAGAQTTRNEPQPMPISRRMPFAPMLAASVAGGILNSIGAALSYCWIARASRDGL